MPRTTDSGNGVALEHSIGSKMMVLYTCSSVGSQEATCTAALEQMPLFTAYRKRLGRQQKFRCLDRYGLVGKTVRELLGNPPLSTKADRYDLPKSGLVRFYEGIGYVYNV